MDSMAKSDYKENDMMKAHRAKVKKVNDSYEEREGISNVLQNPANPGDRVWGGPQGTTLDQTSKVKAGKGKVGPKGTGDQS